MKELVMKGILRSPVDVAEDRRKMRVIKNMRNRLDHLLDRYESSKRNYESDSWSKVGFFSELMRNHELYRLISVFTNFSNTKVRTGHDFIDRLRDINTNHKELFLELTNKSTNEELFKFLEPVFYTIEYRGKKININHYSVKDSFIECVEYNMETGDLSTIRDMYLGSVIHFELDPNDESNGVIEYNYGFTVKKTSLYTHMYHNDELIGICSSEPDSIGKSMTKDRYYIKSLLINPNDYIGDDLNNYKELLPGGYYKDLDGNIGKLSYDDYCELQGGIIELSDIVLDYVPLTMNNVTSLLGFSIMPNQHDDRYVFGIDEHTYLELNGVNPYITVDDKVELYVCDTNMNRVLLGKFNTVHEIQQLIDTLYVS